MSRKQNYTTSDFRRYCLTKNEAIEEYPFGPEIQVFKVLGRMFALGRVDEHPFTMNLKCDPDFADELRRRYPAVQPGYHMSKKHWNTVTLDGTIPRVELEAMIDQSYSLVVATFPKQKQQRLPHTLRKTRRVDAAQTPPVSSP